MNDTTSGPEYYISNGREDGGREEGDYGKDEGDAGIVADEEVVVVVEIMATEREDIVEEITTETALHSNCLCVV